MQNSYVKKIRKATTAKGAYDSMKMKLVNRQNEGEILIEGRLDSNSAPEAETIILDTVEKFDKLILNFAQLEYISSAGLRVLKKTHMAMKKKNGELSLKNVNEMVMEVFEMTGFAGLLHFE